MKRSGPIFSALLLIGVTTSAMASADTGGPYIGLRGTGGYGTMDTISSQGMTAFTVNNDTDQVAGSGGVVGYQFADLPLRIEGEVTYRFRFDFDARDASVPAVGYENNTSSLSALVNLAWEIRQFGPDWVPYLGGSVGLSSNMTDVERNPFLTPITNTENTTNDLAVGIMAGVTYNVTESVGIDLGYRYLNLGEVDSGTLSGGESFKAEDFTINDVTLTFLYRF